MKLIDIFTDYVRNRKSLVDYIEVRKTLHERGEFNDQKLIHAQENLLRLKKEDPELLEAFYDVLDETFRRDQGHTIEYPLTFIREILKLYTTSTPQKIFEEYKRSLDHYFNDA